MRRLLLVAAALPLVLLVGCYPAAPDNGIGFNAVNNADYPAMRRLGATWVRIPIRWNVTYRSPGVDWFGGAKAHVDAAHAAGLRVLAVLMGVPAAERPVGSLPQHYPTSNDRWTQWAMRAVDATRPDVVQVWNEPNHPSYAQPVSVSSYATLLSVAVPALKTRVPVLAAAISPSKSAGTIEGVLFLKYLLNYHPPIVAGWAWNSYPTQTWGDGGRLREARLALDIGGFRQPLWLTEVGWNTDWHLASGQAAIVKDSLAWWHSNRTSLRLGPYMWCEYAGSSFGLTPLSQAAFKVGAK